MKSDETPLSTRLAVPGDAAELLILIRKAMAVYARNSGIDAPLDAELETLEDLQNHIATDTVLLAEQAGQMVGTVRLVRQDPETACFTRFAVLPERQRLGTGQLLFQVAETQLIKAGYTSVLLHTALTNLPLVTFYQTRGFTLLDVSHERGYPRGLFIKHLSADPANRLGKQE